MPGRPLPWFGKRPLGGHQRSLFYAPDGDGSSVFFGPVFGQKFYLLFWQKHSILTFAAGVMKIGSRAMHRCEPCQVLTEAAVSIGWMCCGAAQSECRRFFCAFLALSFVFWRFSFLFSALRFFAVFLLAEAARYAIHLEAGAAGKNPRKQPRLQSGPGEGAVFPSAGAVPSGTFY